MHEMAQDYAGLAVTEIARTVCELLPWKRANGRLKDQECRQLLEYLCDQGWLRLPAVRNSGPRGPRQIDLTEASAPQARVEGSAGEFAPLTIQLVESREESQLWTELIETPSLLAVPGSGRSQSALSGAIGCERRICARLFVVVLAGVEDGGAR